MNENKMSSIHWFPGHMAKARRLIEEQIKLIDIVIEIIDARIPLSSKNPIMDDLIFNKKKIMIMSKIDLADDKKTKEWSNYYSKLGYQVINANLMDFNAFNKIVKEVQTTLADQLEKAERRGLKQRAIRALIVGIPNVGKSTLINKLARRKSAKTGDKAGVTKAIQWIKVNKDFELLDSPGILWPKMDDQQVAINLALTGAIKEEILPKDDLCIYAIKFLNKHYPKEFYERYKINLKDDDIMSVVEVLDKIGKDRGCLMKGQEIDYDKVYNIILKELRNGTIGKVTLDYDVPN